MTTRGTKLGRRESIGGPSKGENGESRDESLVESLRNRLVG